MIVVPCARWPFSMDLNTITEIAKPRQRSEIPDWKPGDAWLAGGTWLFSEPQPALNRLVDISDFGWPSLQISDQGLQIAATCKIAELDGAALPSSWSAAPLFNQCCRAFLASFKIWNMATVGGNLCLALPAGPMISLTTALEGVCTIWGPGRAPRQVPAAEFVTGAGQCARAPGELLRSVHLPARALASATAFRQLSLSALGRSAAVVIGRRAARRTRPDPGTR